MLSNYSTKDFGLAEQLQLTRVKTQKFLHTEMPEIQELDEEEDNQYRNSLKETRFFSARVSTSLDVSLLYQNQIQEEKKEVSNLIKQEQNDTQNQKPYQKSIEKMNTILSDKSLSPLEKLIMIRDVQQLIIREIQEFWESQSDAQEFQIELDRSDILSILIYILIKAKVDDIRTQLVFIEQFCSQYIQQGFSKTSAVLFDLKNAVDFICSLDKNQLQAQGPIYLQNVQIDQLNTKMYQYQDSIDGTSVRTGYDMFGTTNLLGKGDQSLAGSVLSLRQINRVSNQESFFNKNRDTANSQQLKHVIDVKQAGAKRTKSIQNVSLMA